VIGFGNPRYNSMVVYKTGVLLSATTMLRWVDLKNEKVEFERQIGYSQIMQIQENTRYILVLQYDGLVSLLEKEGLEIRHQFYAPGKEIRHASFTDKYLACSCELLHDTEEGLLVSYRIEDIEKGNYQPFGQIRGRFYFPEYLDDELAVLEYHDPNPKGRKRKDTVLQQKLPIKNQLVKFDTEFKIKFVQPIAEEGEIICCTQNKGICYYLHTTKRMTVLDIAKERLEEFPIETKSFPHLVENYKDGVVCPYSSNKLGYITFDFGTKMPKI
jgi:hypothetical protein